MHGPNNCLLNQLMYRLYRTNCTAGDVALILYLTKDWKEQYGGLLVDDEAPEGPKPYVPLFNSAVVFRIPRWHTVGFPSTLVGELLTKGDAACAARVQHSRGQ